MLSKCGNYKPAIKKVISSKFESYKPKANWYDATSCLFNGFQHESPKVVVSL